MTILLHFFVYYNWGVFTGDVYMKLLLIEDHAEISEVIFEYLEIKGHELDYARDGEQGIDLAQANRYDLIILDVMLPGVSGLEVCQRLRANFVNIPILMLTARDSVDDILQGFNSGADDYLVKPFDLGVLEARIKAIHNRKHGFFAGKELTFEDLKLNIQTRILIRDQDPIKLNDTLFKLLKLLMLKAPEVATRCELIQELWPDDQPDEDLLRNQVYRLRNLVDKPYANQYIHSVPKVGYQLRSKVL